MKFNINMGDGVAFDITGKDVLRTAMKMSDAYPGETIMVFAMDVCRLQVLDGKVIEDRADIHPFHDLSHYSPLVQMAIEVQWRNLITADIRAKYTLTDMHGGRGIILPISMAEWDDHYKELSLKFPGDDIGNVIVGNDGEALVARPDGAPGQFIMGLPPVGYYDGCRKLDSEIDFELDWNAITGNAPVDGGVHDASVTMHQELAKGGSYEGVKKRPSFVRCGGPVNWDALAKEPRPMAPGHAHHPINVHSDESTDMSFGLAKLAEHLGQPANRNINIEDRQLRKPLRIEGEYYPEGITSTALPKDGAFIDGANSGERLHAEIKKQIEAGGGDKIIAVIDSYSPMVDDIQGESERVETAEDRKRRFLIHGPDGESKE